MVTIAAVVPLIVPLDAKTEFNKVWNSVTGEYPDITMGFHVIFTIIAVALGVAMAWKLFGPAGNLKDRSVIGKAIGAIFCMVIGWFPKETLGSVAVIFQGLGRAVHKVFQTFVGG